MVFIFGGAYQGKLNYAITTFDLTPDQVFTCQNGDIDFSRPCIDRLEAFTLACVREDRNPVAYFEEHRTQWQDSILICQDLSCGVVPMGADMRAWRQENGRLCQFLSREARQVSRIFCGLEQRLK